MAAAPLAAYGVYARNIAPHEVLKKLHGSGFEKDGICMMLSAAHPISTLVRQASLISPEKKTSVEAARLISWLSELGAVLIPSFGFFIRSQEFFDSLIVEQDSMGHCGGPGTLMALGFPPDAAERLGKQLRHIGVLLYLLCPNASQTKWALELLRGTGAEEVGSLQNDTVISTDLSDLFYSASARTRTVLRLKDRIQ